MRFALLFPGQGSQKVAMGLDLYKETDIGKNLISQVDNLLGRNISNIFLYGPSSELNQTKNTQISIVTISVALILLLKAELKTRNIEFLPFACAGHSLGEFTALWFTNILTLEELIKIISIRGNLMQNAPSGGMAAILNTELENIKKILDSEEFKDKVIIANYNSPYQFVISGQKEIITKVCEQVKSIGGKAIILPVSGAFHSMLMEEPSKMFNLELDKSNILSKQNIKIPIYQNCDGRPTNDPKVINEKIKKQMTSPVYWTQTINNLVNDGVKAVLEIGPGNVLTGLTKKINPNIDCYNIFNLNSLRDFIKNYECEFLSISSQKT